MADFAQIKYRVQPQSERELNPDVHSTNDISRKAFLDVYARELKPGTPSLADQDQELASKLRTELQETRTALEKNVAKQGFIGRTYDWLKGHAGTSSDSKVWLKHEWSGVLNYDDSSTAIENKINETAKKVDSYSKNPSAPSLMQNLQSEITTRSDGTLGLKTNSMVTRYDESQSAGVNGLVDCAVVVTSFSEGKTGASLLRAGLAGSFFKLSLKAADGAYSTPLDDVMSGALMGATFHASRAGRAAADSLVASAERNSLIGRLDERSIFTAPRSLSMLKSGIEVAPVGALTAVSGAYMDFRKEGQSRPGAFFDSLAEAPKGAAQGFAVGALAGLLRVVPPVSGDASVAPSYPPLNNSLAKSAMQGQESYTHIRLPYKYVTEQVSGHAADHPIAPKPLE